MSGRSSFTRFGAGLWLALLPPVALAEVPLPAPDLSGLEAGVEQRLLTAREALLAVVADPDSAPLDRGRLYGRTGRVFQAHHVFTVAEACYRNAAELDPEEILWPYLLGFVLEDTARYDEAKIWYRRALAIDAHHALATLRLARVHLELNEIEEAERLLAEVEDEADLAAPVHAAQGKIATARGAHAEAARHFEEALAAQPQSSQLHYPLALAYRRLGEVEKAREQAALAGTAKLFVPDPILEETGSLSVSSQMFLTTGAQALKAERFDLAEKAFRGAIAVNPENKRAHLNLGVVLARGGDLDAAEECAREALRLDPEYGFAYFNLGTFREARGRLAEAMDLYEQALVKDRGNLKAHFRLANASMRSGDYERAADHYRAAVEIAPGFVRGRYLQGLALIALGRYAAAREVLEEAVKIDPNDPELTGTLARLLASGEARTAEDATRALVLARTLDRGEAENAETLAMALAAAGRFAEAVSTQQSLLDAARGRADPGLVRHLEHNLERYRAGQPSDRPWPLGEEPSAQR